MDAIAWVGWLLMVFAYGLLLAIPAGVLGSALGVAFAAWMFRLARKGEPVSKTALGLGKGSAGILGFLGGATAGLLVFATGAKLLDPVDGYTVHGFPFYVWLLAGIAEIALAVFLNGYTAGLSAKPEPPAD